MDVKLGLRVMKQLIRGQVAVGCHSGRLAWLQHKSKFESKQCLRNAKHRQGRAFLLVSRLRAFYQGRWGACCCVEGI